MHIFVLTSFVFFLFNQAIEEKTPQLQGFHGFLQHRTFVPRVVGAEGGKLILQLLAQDPSGWPATCQPAW